MNPEELYEKSKQNPEEIFLVPLGGCGEFGKNCMLLIHARLLFLIDAGGMFPDHRKLGIQMLLPDISEWVAPFGQVSAYWITHGHEDHIGAVAHLYQEFPAPIYATKWTHALIVRKFGRIRQKPDQKHLIQVGTNESVSFGKLTAHYIQVNHSIPQACSILFETDQSLKVFHSGDFKVDRTKKFEPEINWARMKKIAQNGVDLLFADSTNAHLPGHCPTEESTYEPLLELCQNNPGRIVITTFSSNLWRLLTCIQLAKDLGRRLHICGTGMLFTLSTATELELIDLPEGFILDRDSIETVPPEKTIILTSGCQAEYRSGLSRIAFDEHKQIVAKKEDLIVFSSRSIPGNERDIAFIISLLAKKGCKVITARQHPGIHVSGHAYRDDIAELIDCLKPKAFIPIHGNFSQLEANRLAYLPPLVFEEPLANGTVLRVSRKKTEFIGEVENKINYMDGGSNRLITYEEMRERMRIAELGCLICLGLYSINKQEWIQPVKFLDLGLGLSSEETDRLDALVKKNLKPDKKSTPGQIQEELRLLVRRYLAQLLYKKPVVLSEILFE